MRVLPNGEYFDDRPWDASQNVLTTGKLRDALDKIIDEVGEDIPVCGEFPYDGDPVFEGVGIHRDDTSVEGGELVEEMVTHVAIY